MLLLHSEISKRTVMSKDARFVKFAEDSDFHGVKQITRADNGWVSTNVAHLIALIKIVGLEQVHAWFTASVVTVSTISKHISSSSEIEYSSAVCSRIGGDD